MFDLWEIKEIIGRNGIRRIRKLRTADDRAINEIMRYYGPRKGVFRLLVPRRGSIEVDNEEIDMIKTSTTRSHEAACYRG